MQLRVFGCPPHLGMRTDLLNQTKEALSGPLLFFCHSSYARLREMSEMTATNSADPMIDHRTG